MLANGGIATFTIRPAVVDDIQALATLHASAMHTLNAALFTPAQALSFARYGPGFDASIVHEGTYRIAGFDGVMIGGGGWSRQPGLHPAGHSDDSLVGAPDAVRLRGFFVVPALARRGAGRAIVTRCELEATCAGASRIELLASPVGEPFFAACGYVVITRQEVVHPDGVGFSLARMEKYL